MPSYTRGRRRNVTAYVAVNQALMYGFKTKDLSDITGVGDADITALGHVPVPPQGRLVCIGANSPKPPRVVKRLISGNQGSVSTFCAYDRLTQAYGAGWTLAKPGREVGLRTDGRSITAIVEMADNGILYCYSLNRQDFDSYAADLGLQSAASITTQAELNRLVVGASLPKPGKAMKRLQNGSTVSTFYAPEKRTELQQPATGWRVMSSARLAPVAAPPQG